ncbi:AICARFT/IMPCHase bienzyme [uncultured Desulfatiglans sp.]|uniref:AICARFT/IMPCHase bienzyme n=1 Tax=Uncultured Desulfatiglans sp. TaxID=1748965 RepID=A0A653A2Z5_UNCDX|nr:AICARFT/IMPCHase bienzyme [uncultured Desulfatiglans sp.]
MGQDLKQMYRTVMDDHFPDELTISFGGQTLVYRKRTWRIPDEKTGGLVEKGLRYGENPGQEAALYELTGGNLILGGCEFIRPGWGLVSAVSEQHMLQSGKHPGKINLTDLDNALNILKYLKSRPAAVIVKHNNPCGVAYGETCADAYLKADMADRIAAFGGCAVFNRPIDPIAAAEIAKNYLEVVGAPDFEEGALDILKKRSNLRVIRVPGMERLEAYAALRFVDFKSLMDGGLILQQSPLNAVRSAADLKPASAVHDGRSYSIERAPAPQEVEDLLFGWQVEQGVTSNSVLYVKDGVTVGIGTGEQDRVGVAEIAVFKAYTKYADALCFRRHGQAYKDLELQVRKGEKARDLLEEIKAETAEAKGGLIGASMVSDAFFPFRDGVDVGIREGIGAVIQPGGSLRDFEVIDACNEARPQVTMVFTGQRAFRH